MTLRAHALALAGAAALAAGLAGTPGSLAPAPPSAAAQGSSAAPASRPSTSQSYTAFVLSAVRSRKAPRPNAAPGPKVSLLGPYARHRQKLLVLGVRTSQRYGTWYQVRLPNRPNTASGWVPASKVRVAANPYRVLVDLSERSATFFRAGRSIGRYKVAVGQRAYPTPQGSFAISEIVRQSTSSGFFGPYIVTLTAHSEQLNDFGGGDGRVALHGTSLPFLLGSAASHGCVRFSNDAITAIARRAPQGTPVDVVA